MLLALNLRSVLSIPAASGEDRLGVSKTALIKLAKISQDIFTEEVSEMIDCRKISLRFQRFRPFLITSPPPAGSPSSVFDDLRRFRALRLLGLTHDSSAIFVSVLLSSFR